MTASAAPALRRARHAAVARRTAFGCTLATGVSSAPVVNATFGVFLLPLAAALHGTRAGASSLLLVAAASCALAYPLAGRAADRFGARRVAAIGNVLFALALAAVPLLGPDRGRDVLIFAALGVASAIPSGVVFSRLVAGWFDRRRGFVLGLVGGLGNGIGATVMPLAAEAALSLAGWRRAYLLLALLVLLVGQAAIAILRDPPSDAPPAGAQLVAGARPALEQHGFSLGAAVRTRRFAAVLALATIGAGALNAVFTHVVAMATDRGLSAGLGAGAVAAFALTGSAWQMAFGALLDRSGTPRIMAPVLLLAIPGILLLSEATAPVLLFAGAMLAGLALGAEYAAIPFLLSRYFGLRHFGVINGVVSGVNAVVIGATPMLIDLGYGHTGSYRPGLVTAAAGLAIAAAIASTLPTTRK